MASRDCLLQADLPLPLVARGKVRDVFAVDDQHLLFVASDRISAFDVVMADGIPGKGRILTAISRFWFGILGDVCANHLVTADIDAMPAEVRAHRDQLDGRCMLVRRLRILPVEAIVRGFLAGSGWKEYQKTRTVCGLALPAGLVESSELPRPLYTPSTKAAIGAHDENIHPDEAARIIGPHAAAVATTAVRLYEKARDHARRCGIIIADTKFEFGVDAGGALVLADEVLTPDSSRFWPALQYRPGGAQASFDKQYLRDWLESIRFDKSGPGIPLPADVVRETQAKYLQACQLLTGSAPAI
jgi:phosphoribosylaminoimidazole-succinocarboxamide synthase